SGHHGADRVNEVLGGRSLEHVAARARVERLLEIGAILMEGEHHDAHARELVGEATREQDAVELGHRDVDDRHVGALFPDESQRGRAAAGVAHQLEIALRRDEVAQAGEHDRVIVGQDDAGRRRHATILSGATGMRAKMAVPAPTVDSISTSPPSSATRSRIPASPNPPRSRPAVCSEAGSKPRPSSSMMMRIVPSTRSMTTLTEVASGACLATLVSPSCTTR